jgi:ABC-type uncharacterized transport system substrate-binding protein
METKRRTKMSHKVLATLALIGALIALVGCLAQAAPAPTPEPAATLAAAEQAQPASKETPVAQRANLSTKKFKILHIMSYDSDWEWNQTQLSGFKDALKDIDNEYKLFEMDTRRHSSPEWIDKVSKEAMNLIDTWKPDLVYTNDDNAQKYVVVHYVNTATPFVFSGVNASAETYGFNGSTNVTGVFEQEHFVQTMQLLKEIAPNAKKIAVVFDDDATWPPVLERMQAKQNQLPDLKFISWDTIHTFAEYKQKMAEYQTTADAVGLIGVLRFKDEKGDNVPFEDVLRWTVENSKLPDFSFWDNRVSNGTLCAMTVSGYEQGLEAGKMARGILVEGKSPASFPMEPTIKGQPVVNLARAKKLGIPMDSNILLTAKVLEKFDWEK